MSLNLKYKSTHKASPPHKSKGKSTKCTPYCTFRPKIPIAACDLAPQTEMTTVCLVFCINPSSMARGLELDAFLVSRGMWDRPRPAAIFACKVIRVRKAILYKARIQHILWQGRRCCLGDRLYLIPVHQDEVKNRMNCTRMILRKWLIHPILQIVLVQNSLRGKELNKFFPPNGRDDLCLFVCIYPSSLRRQMYGHVVLNIPHSVLLNLLPLHSWSSESVLPRFEWTFFTPVFSSGQLQIRVGRYRDFRLKCHIICIQDSQYIFGILYGHCL